MSDNPGFFPTFEDFFRELHDGLPPYSWQKALARQVQEEGWPDEISVPTGLGKTSVIAIWLYELARQIHFGEKRTVPMRLFYVVNRRLVVDQGFRYAEKIKGKTNGDSSLEHPSLTERDNVVLKPVREALRTVLPPGDERLLVTDAIHGEDPDDKEWMRATGATIVSLTPAQLVSRMLMRGFNVTEGLRSMHAGLVGMDRLVLFDEPHLSLPAITAMQDQERSQRRGEDLGIPVGKTVRLGATIPVKSRDQDISDTSRFAFDLEETLHEDAAKKRLEASKQLRFLSLKSTTPSTLGTSAKKFVSQALEEGNTRTLLVLNTVDAAQQVFEQIRKQVDTPESSLRVRLLTSRFRGIDGLGREDLEELKAGPLILVATQTVEVGMDISFDALFTEAASFDALVQRLGRLNRDGSSSDARVVLAVQEGAEDQRFKVSKSTAFIYEEPKVLAALQLLEEAQREDGYIDVSSAALLRLKDRGGAAIESTPERAATLHRGLVPVLTHTRPTPKPDIPVEAFISGPDQNKRAEVEVAWRPELASLAGLETRVAASPLGPEYVSVPLGQVKSLLTLKDSTEPLTDLGEGEDARTNLGPLKPEVKGKVLVLNLGEKKWVPVTFANQIRPGAKVVLQDDLGGYTPKLGWFPKSTVPVLTVQLRALYHELKQQEKQKKFREPKALRLAVNKELEKEVDFAEEANFIKGAVEANTAYMEALRGEDDRTIERAEDELAEKVNALISCLTKGKGRTLTSGEVAAKATPSGLIVPVKLAPDTPDPGLASEVCLYDHSRQVSEWAEETARRVGLDEALVNAVSVAGWFHDAGKKWENFQEYLANSTWKLDGKHPEEQRLLAKPVVSHDVFKRKLERKSKVPRGWRHEAYSLAFIPAVTPEFVLVSHLVASHHGYSRPGFLPLEEGMEENLKRTGKYPHPLQELGVSRADDFQALNERFGPWGLAYLETVVRLADWTASANPEPSTKSGEKREVSFEEQPIRQGKEEISPERSLEGLGSSPHSSWYVAVGLLAAAEEMGDSGARLRWGAAEPLAGVAPAFPVLFSRFTLEELVEHIHGSDQWERIKSLLKQSGCVELGIKGQKIGPASRLRKVLSDADKTDLNLALGSITDARAADKGRVALAIPAFQNQSSYPQSALKVVESPEGISNAVAALEDPDVGYAKGTQDGGFDRSKDYSPSSTGRVGKDARLVRTALAGVAFFGMTALGAVPPRGIGCAYKTMVLPLPTVPSSLAQIQALTLTGLKREKGNWEALGAEWVLAGKKKFDENSKQEWWATDPVLRVDIKKDWKKEGSLSSQN